MVCICLSGVVRHPTGPLHSTWGNGGIFLGRASQCLWWGVRRGILWLLRTGTLPGTYFLQFSLPLSLLSPPSAPTLQGERALPGWGLFFVAVSPLLVQAAACCLSHGKGVWGLVSKESILPGHLLSVELLNHPHCQCCWLAWWCWWDSFWC